MYNFFAKNGIMLAFGLGTVITILFLIMVVVGSADTVEVVDSNGNATLFGNAIDLGIRSSAFLIFVGVALLLAFGIWQVVSDLSGSLKGLIGLALIVVLLGITYATSSYETSGPLADLYYEYSISEGTAKFINAGILTSAILAGIGAVGIVIAEVANFFK